MQAERDKDVIGLNPEAQAWLREIEESGWFEDAQDIARFCLAYAIRAHVPMGDAKNVETRWAAGNFDKTGELRAVLRAIYPFSSTPIRLMEHLVNEGLRVVGKVLRDTGSLDSCFEEPTPPPPLVLFDTYRVVARLKSGGMAEAFKVVGQDSTTRFFLKRVRVDTLNEMALLREQHVYSRLQHSDNPALLQIVDWKRDNEYAAIVTEFATGGSLNDYVTSKLSRHLDVVETRKIALTVLDSIAALHELNIVHRDIKPDNILLHGLIWKLADFGIAKNLNRPVTGHTFQQHSTPGYSAPEQVDGVNAHPSADVYSFGKVIVFMLTGQTDPDLVTLPAWRMLARSCTDVNPDTRPSLDQIRKCLEQIRNNQTA